MIRRNLTTRESIGYCKAQVVSQFAVQFFRGRAWALFWWTRFSAYPFAGACQRMPLKLPAIWSRAAAIEVT